jgi:hypothetical protein
MNERQMTDRVLKALTIRISRFWGIRRVASAGARVLDCAPIERRVRWVSRSAERDPHRLDIDWRRA